MAAGLSGCAAEAAGGGSGVCVQRAAREKCRGAGAAHALDGCGLTTGLALGREV